MFFRPDVDFNGDDGFTYEVCDDENPVPACDAGEVTIEVTPVNDAPVGADDQAEGTAEDTPLVGVLSVSDVDDENLTCTVVTDVVNGTLELSEGCGFTYTPASRRHTLRR